MRALGFWSTLPVQTYLGVCIIQRQEERQPGGQIWQNWASSGSPFLVEDVGQEGRKSLRLDLSLLPKPVKVKPERQQLLHRNYV